MKRILITGGNGLLGQAVTKLFARETNYDLLVTGRSHDFTLPSPDIPYRMLDVTDRKNVRETVSRFRPDVIVHTAAKTDVDACERERESAHLQNTTAVEYLVEAVRTEETRIILISTDYIFNGGRTPYNEAAVPEPLNYYGRTKLAGENVLRGSGISHAVVRSMILYGTARGVKPNFALWVIQSLMNQSHIRVVTDQIGQPTYVDDCAYGILKIIELERSGVYHIAGSETISRYDFALKIAEVFRLDHTLIHPVKTDELKQTAPRPRISEFITQKAQMELGLQPLNVHEGLVVMKKQIEQDLKHTL